jgi:YfiH family protein
VFLHHPLFSSRGIEHGFGTRNPSSAGQDACFFRQVHGTSVLETFPGGATKDRPEADGGWTSCPGTAVAVWTADCVPVLISDEQGEFVAAVHAGWRGTVRGILPEAIRTLRSASGQDSSRFFSVIGPSIKSCCYTVGADVWSEVSHVWPSWKPRRESSNLDLAGLLRHQLFEEGFGSEQIGEISLCTRCHPDLFFSHRGMGEKRAGRSMLNFIRRKG